MNLKYCDVHLAGNDLHEYSREVHATRARKFLTAISYVYIYTKTLTNTLNIARIVMKYPLKR